MAIMYSEKVDKMIIRGGYGSKWGRQYHQQDRVYDRKGISPAVNASANNGGFIRKWNISELNRQQKKDI